MGRWPSGGGGADSFLPPDFASSPAPRSRQLCALRQSLVQLRGVFESPHPAVCSCACASLDSRMLQADGDRVRPPLSLKTSSSGSKAKPVLADWASHLAAEEQNHIIPAFAQDVSADVATLIKTLMAPKVCRCLLRFHALLPTLQPTAEHAHQVTRRCHRVAATVSASSTFFFFPQLSSSIFSSVLSRLAPAKV